MEKSFRGLVGSSGSGIGWCDPKVRFLFGFCACATFVFWPFFGCLFVGLGSGVLGLYGPVFGASGFGRVPFWRFWLPGFALDPSDLTYGVLVFFLVRSGEEHLFALLAILWCGFWLVLFATFLGFCQIH